MSGAPYLLTYTSLPQIQPPTQKQMLIHATDTSDAWEQARMRLGDTKYVVSIKPLMGEPS